MNKPVYVSFKFSNENEVGAPISFKIAGDNDYNDLLVTFKPENNKEYYLLYVQYSDGDSENTNYGKKCYVEMYEDFSLAEENAKIIRAHYTARDKLIKNDVLGDWYNVNLKQLDGSFQKFHGPWIGYFEHIEEIFVVKLQLGKENIWKY